MTHEENVKAIEQYEAIKSKELIVYSKTVAKLMILVYGCFDDFVMTTEMEVNGYSKIVYVFKHTTETQKAFKKARHIARQLKPQI